MRRLKGQVAMEYMLVVMLVLLFIIPVWSYMSTVHTETQTELYYSYAKNTAKKIVDNAELVYSQGVTASVNVNVYIPRYVEQANITNTTVIFRMNTGMVQDISHFGVAELNGTLPIREGNYLIHIESMGDYVQIDPV